MLDQLVTAIDSFNKKIKELPDGPLTSSPIADKLENKTVSELQADVDTTVTSHVDTTGNVHNVTPEDIDGYSVEESDILFDTYTRPSVLPIDNYVAPGTLFEFDVNHFTINTELDVTHDVIWHMRNYSFINQSFELDTLFPSEYQNTDFYIYIHIQDIEDSNCSLVIAKDNDLDLDLQYIKIGEINTLTDGVDSITINNVSRLAGKNITDLITP